VSGRVAGAVRQGLVQVVAQGGELLQHQVAAQQVPSAPCVLPDRLGGYEVVLRPVSGDARCGHAVPQGAGRPPSPAWRRVWI
jgi:hypothetical protein